MSEEIPKEVLKAEATLRVAAIRVAPVVWRSDGSVTLWSGKAQFAAMAAALAEARRERDAAAALASERLDVSGLKDQDRLRLQAERNEARRALAWYPFGGLDGLLGEIEQHLRAHDAVCTNLESCGPLGCLLAKIHHARKEVRAALGRPAPDGETLRQVAEPRGARP